MKTPNSQPENTKHQTPKTQTASAPAVHESGVLSPESKVPKPVGSSDASDILKLAKFISEDEVFSKFINDAAVVDVAMEIMTKLKTGRQIAEEERQKIAVERDGLFKAWRAVRMESLQGIGDVGYRRTGNCIEIRHHLSLPESDGLMNKITALLEANGVRPA